MKKLLAWGLALCLLLAAPAALAENELAFEAYKDTVTLTSVINNNPTVTLPDGCTWEDNYWTRAYLEKFNIKLDIQWDSSEYETKLNLAIASGNLPDVFYCTPAQFSELSDAGMLADMTDTFEKYASDQLRANYAADQAAFESGKVDGKLYGMAQLSYGIIDEPDYVWLRDDWMKKLNLSAPTTWDEFVAVCKAFKEQDPDGDGAADTYGLACDRTLTELLMLMPSFHANPNIWVKDESGQIVYGSVQPNVKTALAAFQQMYKDGLLSTEFTAMDSVKMNEDVISGKVGAVPFYQWFGYAPGPDIISTQGPDAIFYPYSLPSSDGNTVMHSISWKGGNYTVVNKDCKNPEAAIKLMNFYAYVFNNSTVDEYQHFMAVANGQHQAQPFIVNNPMTDYNQYVACSAAIEKRDNAGLTVDQAAKYDYAIDWLDNKTPASVGYYLQISNKGAYSLAKEVLDKGEYYVTELKGVNPPTLNEKGSTLDALLLEGFTKIITGQEDVDYFDEVVANWKSTGGDQITTEMNEMYNQK